MFSVYRYGKRILLKKLATDSAGLLQLLHTEGLISNSNLLECRRNPFFFNFTSVANVSSLDLDSGTAISAPKGKSESTENLARENSYKVSYLINSCGLSAEEAISASEKLHFETPKRPDSVLTFLKERGFSSAQIASIVKRRPKLLLNNPEKFFLPKLEFFKSIGVSNAYLVRIISRDPDLLVTSLKNRIIPNYNNLKSVLFTDERVSATLKVRAWIFMEDPSKNISPNITVLKELDVPLSCIVMLLAFHPETIVQKHDEFRASVSAVLEMGFNPLKSVFVMAIHAISGESNKRIWARSFNTYRKLGWSKDDINMAFRKQPICMLLSESKISKTVDYLVNKMGWESKVIVSCPMLLFFNFEKRIIPRCSILQFLISRNLIHKKDVKLSSLLAVNEERFLKRFVTKYEKQVPKLYDFYEGKVGIEEL